MRENLSKNPDELVGNIELPQCWRKTITGYKITSQQLPKNFVSETVTVLGGICSLFTGDSESIRKGEIKFSSELDFENWLKSWYPRIDQIHDAVGIPPKAVKQIIYVCEDSLFGKRISKWTKLNVNKITDIIRTVHEQQGKPVIERWLRLQGGYKGEIDIVYTSDLESKIDASLRTMQTIIGEKFKPKLKDRAKVNLMYTKVWLDVLAVDGTGLVYEPDNHGLEFEFFPALEKFITENPYGKDGFNSDIGILGYRQYSDKQGATRTKPFQEVFNFSNWQNPKISDPFDLADNFFPQAQLNSMNIENKSDAEQVTERIKFDLGRVYGGTNEK